MELRYFKLEEFDCSETGENEMSANFLKLLDSLRHACGFPFIIVSGYRSPLHSKEIIKEKPGMHPEGKAADIRVSGGAQRYKVVKTAAHFGFTGIGVAGDFVHLDLRMSEPMLWVY